MMKRAKPSNQGGEWRFSRLGNNVSYRSGGYVKMGQLGARHTVAEHASRWGALARETLAASRVGAEVESGCNSPWMLFCARRRKCYDESMPQATLQWARMDDTAKAEVAHDFEEVKADDERIRNARTRQLRPDETPHCLGDHEWPVSPSNCSHLCYGQKLSDVAQTWHSKFGHHIDVKPEAVSRDATLPHDFTLVVNALAHLTVGRIIPRTSASNKLTSKTRSLCCNGFTNLHRESCAWRLHTIWTFQRTRTIILTYSCCRSVLCTAVLKSSCSIIADVSARQLSDPRSSCNVWLIPIMYPMPSLHISDTSMLI